MAIKLSTPNPKWEASSASSVPVCLRAELTLQSWSLPGCEREEAARSATTGTSDYPSGRRGLRLKQRVFHSESVNVFLTKESLRHIVCAVHHSNFNLIIYFIIS